MTVVSTTRLWQEQSIQLLTNRENLAQTALNRLIWVNIVFFIRLPKYLAVLYNMNYIIPVTI